MPRPGSFALSGLVLLCACSSQQPPSASLSVDVVTGLVPGPEFRHAVTEVFDGAGSTTHNRLLVVERGASFGEDFVSGLRVARLELDPGEYIVKVSLLRADRRLLVGRRVRMTLREGESLAEVFTLTEDCVGDVVCPSPGGSAAFTECLAGQCVDPACRPPDELDACPDFVFCLNDGDCRAPSECSTVRCVGGVCVPRPIEGACAEDEFCSPTAGGCAPLSGTGASSGQPTCGAFCEEDCFAGIWTCDEGAARCTVVAFKDAGAPCGSGGACDGGGACVLP